MKHSEFWRSRVDFGSKARAPAPTGEVSKPNKLEVLPTDPIEAIREVFYQEFNALMIDRGLSKVSDLLVEKFPDFKCDSAPYRFDKFSGKYVLRDEYERLRVPRRQLDPFNRFQFDRVPAKEMLMDQYVESGDAMSVAYRAIVGHFASCHDAKCIRCASEAIHWNGYTDGGGFRYWKKLVCDACGSVYEIKTSRTEALIEKKFTSVIYGGDYDKFHSVQRELPSSARQFVAMLSQESALHHRKWCWPVYVAEVDSTRVVPDLKARSFCPDDRKPKVYSRFSVKPGWSLWFYAPVFEFDVKAMAEEVLEAL